MEKREKQEQRRKGGAEAAVGREAAETEPEEAKKEAERGEGEAGRGAQARAKRGKRRPTTPDCGPARREHSPAPPVRW